MLAILQDLHHEDHFGIIQFDDTILRWKNSLMKATRENVTEAMKYVKKIKDNGSEIQTVNIKDKKLSSQLKFQQFLSSSQKEKTMTVQCHDPPPLTGTNINDAVLSAVDMLKRDRGGTQTSVDMIILLTDGMPNSGEFLRTCAHMNTGIILQGKTETCINRDILKV